MSIETRAEAETPLTAESLLMGPKQLEAYSFGKLTRENFNDFLIKSFAWSRGARALQLEFFQWSEAHSGTTLRPIFEAMRKHGINAVLSIEERARFLAMFDRVPKHAVIYESRFRTENNIGSRELTDEEHLDYLHERHSHILEELNQTFREYIEETAELPPSTIEDNRRIHGAMNPSALKEHLQAMYMRIGEK